MSETIQDHPGTGAAQSVNTASQRDKLEQQHKNGANWFFWIAALSMVNSAILVFGGQWSFIVGLGATQLVDAVVLVVAGELGGAAGIAAKVVALVVDAFIAGVFVFFGYFAHKRHAWAFVVGMALYVLDGLIFVLFSDWLSVGFHAFALFCIFGGFAANRGLAALSGSPEQSVRTPDPITPA